MVKARSVVGLDLTSHPLLEIPRAVGKIVMYKTFRLNLKQILFRHPSVYPQASTIDANLLIQETPQLPRPAGMLQLPQRLGLDLADTLAGDAELLPHLFERVVGVHPDAESHPQHPLLARGE